MRRHNLTQGFTIIEVLVAILLFAVIVVVIVAPLTGVFGLTRNSTDQINATNLAQQVLEEVRGQWLDQGKYNQTCINLTLPSGITSLTSQSENVQGNALDANGNATTEQSISTSCSATAGASSPDPLRLVRVRATVNNTVASLSVEVARP